VSVRSSLLAILTIGPAYGFQLHTELALRTAHRRGVNVGQIYATLERLMRQGSVESAGSTADGLPLYSLTPAGAIEASAWLTHGEPGGDEEWNDLVDRIVLASTLPGVDIQTIIATTRLRWTDAVPAFPAPLTAQDRLIESSRQALTSTVTGWLDDTAALLAIEGTASFHRDLSTDRPVRGRRPTPRP
jgi:DNA-binding PadR family transcriptional regulator